VFVLEMRRATVCGQLARHRDQTPLVVIIFIRGLIILSSFHLTTHGQAVKVQRLQNRIAC